MNTQPSCNDRIDEELQGRLDDLRQLWDAQYEDIEDLGNLNEYGLSFDYVEPGTFDGQKEGYFRYQLSWGGPSDEFRIYVNMDKSIHRIEYWFLDWYDGANRIISDEEDCQFIWDMMRDFVSMSPELEY